MSGDTKLTTELRRLFLGKRTYRMKLMTLEEKQQKYQALLHAMQTGVKYELENDPRSGTPKHLRVGVNSAMVNHGALVKLLIAKGIFTEDEYFDVLIEMMQREVDSYQERLSKIYGANITLA